MFIIDLKPRRAVAFFLPEDWWKHRGDVCLYASGREVAFVERDRAGYQRVPIYLAPNNRRPWPVDAEIAEDEATIIVDKFNRETMGVDPDEVDRIVSSSMRAQNGLGMAVVEARHVER